MSQKKPQIWFKAAPFDKGLVTLALESGVDVLVAEAGDVDAIRSLARVEVLPLNEIETIALNAKDDEERCVQVLKSGRKCALSVGWEIIPVENILAQTEGLILEAESLDRARLAAGILERGADVILLTPSAAPEMKKIVAELKLSRGRRTLVPARVTAIRPVGLGHRVCVDTLSMLKTGQGMLIGNSSAFAFLVHAETESNPYVAARPFRINAGAVHAYALMPGDRTRYLEELASGDEVMIVAADGSTSAAVIGRIKTEVRPMLQILAVIDTPEGPIEGGVFLQNAETIRVVRPDGSPVSVVELKVGDALLCHTDKAGRHFGMRISEEIKEG